MTLYSADVGQHFSHTQLRHGMAGYNTSPVKHEPGIFIYTAHNSKSTEHTGKAFSMVSAEYTV